MFSHHGSVSLFRALSDHHGKTVHSKDVWLMCYIYMNIWAQSQQQEGKLWTSTYSSQKNYPIKVWHILCDPYRIMWSITLHVDYMEGCVLKDKAPEIWSHELYHSSKTYIMYFFLIISSVKSVGGWSHINAWLFLSNLQLTSAWTNIYNMLLVSFPFPRQRKNNAHTSFYLAMKFIFKILKIHCNIKIWVIL